MSGTKINRFLEILRWCGVAFGIFLAFLWGTGPVQQFNIFSIISLIFIAGLTAFEGLFFSKSASEVSGYGEGGAYQRQSALHFLALVIVLIIAVIFDWGLFAYVGLFMVLVVFLTLSAINHLLSGIKEKFVLNTILRPLLVIFLWLITLYFLLPVL
ncbi:MAG: hypothetical protein LLF83_10920 [Methanobacterium sp.]|nr:hypothetical protein [Methanobacterium sp.]